MAPTSFPSQVLIVRHGEKPGDPCKDDDNSGPDLSVRGSARAAALPSLFALGTVQVGCPLMLGTSGFSATYAPTQIAAAAARFPAPKFLFATEPSGSSNRPVETITPLSAAANLTIDQKHPDKDYHQVAKGLLHDTKYAGEVVLICWHHGKIPKLAGKLGVANAPGTWDCTVFDRVWQIIYTNGQAALTILPQMLLYGDSAS